MRDDERRWDERYATTSEVDPRGPEAIGHWPELESLLPTTGRCVDVACGPGAVALWLAARGMHVVAVDVSTVAIDLLLRSAGRAGLAERIDARLVDLDDGLPADLHDLDLIVCQRFRDPTLMPAIIERLSSGGVAIVTVLSTVGADDAGPFRAPPGELRTAFTDERCDVVRHHEGAGVAHIVIRRH